LNETAVERDRVVVVVVVVVLVVGPISTAAVKAYYTLTPSGVPSIISRGAAHQAT